MLPDQQAGKHILEQPMELLKMNHSSIPPSNQQEKTQTEETGLNVRERIQRDLMLDSLKRTNGNVTAAAKFLGIPRSTFYKRLKKFGI